MGNKLGKLVARTLRGPNPKPKIKERGKIVEK